MKSLIAIAVLAGCGGKPKSPLACRDYDELAQIAVTCKVMTPAAAAQVHLDMLEARGPEAEQRCRGMFAGLKASVENCADAETFYNKLP